MSYIINEYNELNSGFLLMLFLAKEVNCMYTGIFLLKIFIEYPCAKKM